MRLEFFPLFSFLVLLCCVFSVFFSDNAPLFFIVSFVFLSFFPWTKEGQMTASHRRDWFETSPEGRQPSPLLVLLSGIVSGLPLHWPWLPDSNRVWTSVAKDKLRESGASSAPPIVDRCIPHRSWDVLQQSVDLPSL